MQSLSRRAAAVTFAASGPTTFEGAREYLKPGKRSGKPFFHQRAIVFGHIVRT
jgi:hypothetical protein